MVCVVKLRVFAFERSVRDLINFSFLHHAVKLFGLLFEGGHLQITRLVGNGETEKLSRSSSVVPFPHVSFSGDSALVLESINVFNNT